MKRFLGMDLVDVGIHAFVTVCVAAMMANAMPGPDSDIAVPMVLAASGVVFAIRRRRALRRLGPAGPTTAEVEADRLAELELRVADLEAAQARVLELEERVDFSERLLARQGRAPAGSEVERHG